MRTILIALAIAAAGVSSPALADWQYTKWGMSPAEVALASKGAASISNGQPGDRYAGAEIGAVGTYQSGDYSFDAVFYFVANKLADIRLKLANSASQAYRLKNDLDGVYGKAFDESKSLYHLITYHDVPKNNRVDLLIIGDKATLEYRPLKDGSASGL